MNPYGLVVRQIIGRMRMPFEERFTLVSEHAILDQRAFVFVESGPLTATEAITALGEYGLHLAEARCLLTEARLAFTKWLRGAYSSSIQPSPR